MFSSPRAAGVSARFSACSKDLQGLFFIRPPSFSGTAVDSSPISPDGRLSKCTHGEARIDFSHVERLKLPQMSGQFPSGQWVGFCTYGASTRKHLMDLVLEFKGGKMTGEGADGIGLFVMSGSYSEKTGECSWVKQYVGAHAVDYNGV